MSAAGEVAVEGLEVEAAGAEEEVAALEEGAREDDRH